MEIVHFKEPGMKLIHWAAGAAAVLSFAAGSANATTFLLTQDFCSGTCGKAPFGKVTVTQVGPVANGEVDVTVTLDAGEFFHDTNDSQHHALAFDLVSSLKSITISGLPSPFTANGVQKAGAVADNGAGAFEFDVNFPHENKPPQVATFSFDIFGTNLNPNDFVANKSGVFFATDIVGLNGHTGSVGAISAIPEPATWAMMLVGFGGLGATLRRARRPRALAAI
jgi:hypothetical protein